MGTRGKLDPTRDIIPLNQSLTWLFPFAEREVRAAFGIWRPGDDEPHTLRATVRDLRDTGGDDLGVAN